MFERTSKVAVGSQEEPKMLEEMEEFQKNWNLASTRKKELTHTLIEACRQIRTGLVDDGQSVQINEHALKSFLASPIISRTGVAELYDSLKS
jgi:hypothetical protein